jgi:hypothetical protein
MARMVVENALDPESCREVCRAIDRSAYHMPDEEDPDTLIGVGDSCLTDVTASLSLEDVARFETVRNVLIHAADAFAGTRRLVADFTFFKRANPGHAKGPHLDTNGYEHRILTAILYFNDCNSGPISFGRFREDANRRCFVEEESFLPAAGRMVLFDAEPTNAHKVDLFREGFRYSVMMWFRAAGERDFHGDWIARYLNARKEWRFVVDATDARSTMAPNGRYRIELSSPNETIVSEIAAAHYTWFERVLRMKQGFTVTELIEVSPNSVRPLLQLLSLLARASMLRRF